MILDEATSSLDSDSESYVQATIHQLVQDGKTIVVIAHRLSTVVNADQIVVLSQGVVVEEGSHSQLYASRGVYFDMWQKHLPAL